MQFDRVTISPCAAAPQRRGRRIIAMTIASLAALWLTGCTSESRSAPDTAAANAAPSGIIAPNVDTRDYRALVLNNALEVVLVADPDADKAAASLVVARGSFDDPDDRLGLAHFLEHMLFLGTQKFPDPDEYQAFVSANGGSHNAYTASDHTNYFFDITPDKFDESLDRFSQFFIAPLFNEAYVDREKNAVNSEYELQLKDDGWRGNAVSRVVVNPAHPASRFNIGSVETLADRPNRSTRDALLTWFEQNYSSNQMKLVLIAPLPLSELERLARQYFSAIENRALPDRASTIALLRADTSDVRVLRYRPEQDARSVTFSFPVPPLDENYRENPVGYISNLLGHEGAGSLHEQLKGRGWIESLGAGGGRIDSANAQLTVSIALTPAGMGHIEQIGTALFAYINQLQRSGVSDWRYAEQRKLAGLAFNYREQSQPASYARGIAASMLRYPTADVLRGPYAMDTFDPSMLKQYLAQLTPAKVMIELADPAADTDAVEAWFGVPYRVTGLPPAWAESWTAAANGKSPSDFTLALPDANPFVPENLALIETSHDGIPERLDGPVAAWARPDSSFGIPRANVQIEVAPEGLVPSPLNSAHAAMYVRLVQDQLNAYAYPAQLAGMGYSVSAGSAGLRLSLSGYQDKQPVLLKSMLEALLTVPIDPDRFALYHAELSRNWLNSKKDRPYTQALAALSQFVVRPAWTPEQLLTAMPKVSTDSLEQWRKNIMRPSHVTLLAHGNLVDEQVTELSNLLAEFLEVCNQCARPSRTTLAIPGGITRVNLAIEHDNAAVVTYLQGTSTDYAERARYGVMAHLLRPHYFNQLRTEQQLGYVVAAIPRVFNRVPGIAFVVQSPSASAGAIETATTTFLQEWAQSLSSMTPEQFASEKNGLLTLLRQRDKNLAERTGRFWSDLVEGITTFDSREQIALLVEELELPEFRRFAQATLTQAQQNRLNVFSPGQFAELPAGGDVDDAQALKSTLAPIAP